MPTLDEELSKLEDDIRRLRIEYESFFVGGRSRPPSDIEWRVEQTIKKYAGASRRLKYAHRYRYDNLAQRYAKFSELWRQRMRQKEAGFSPYVVPGVVQRESERVIVSSTAPSERRVLCSDPLREPERVQDLYRTLVEARQKVGQKAEINFEQFHRFVRQKTEQLKRQLGCQQVEYTVVVESGQVKLKAKGK